MLRSGWIGCGPKTVEFEEAIASLTLARHCVAVNSGTAAVHLALLAAGVGPGVEVISPAMTFVSVNQAILHTGGVPVFADIERETGNLSVISIREKISERTKVILPVHYGGNPCDLDEIYALAEDAGATVIEDCAHALGATYKGRAIGSFGHLHALSFQACKTLTTGDGGAILTSSLETAERMRRLRNLGVDRSSFDRFKSDQDSWAYDVVEIGFKCAMNDIAAAIGLASLPHLERSLAHRSSIASHYRARLASHPDVRFLDVKGDRAASNFLFPILADRRDELIEKLNQNGVEVSVHFPRNDVYPMFEKQDLPETDYFSSHQISLPIHSGLTEAQIDRVCDLITGGW